MAGTFELGFSFTPQDNGLLKFLATLKKALESLGLDTSEFNIDELAAEFQKTQDAISDVHKDLQEIPDDLKNIGNTQVDIPDLIVPPIDVPVIPPIDITVNPPTVPELDTQEIPPIDIPVNVPVIPTPEVPVIPPIDIPPIDPPKINLDDLAAEFDKVKKGLDEVADKQRKALIQLELTGGKGTSGYEQLKKELDETEKKLKEINDIAGGEGGKSIMETIFEFEAVKSAGEFLTGISEKATETNEAFRLLEGRTQATGSELEGLKNIAADLFSDPATLRGFDSLSEAIDAVGQSKKLLKDALDPQGLKDYTAGAAALGKVMGTEVGDVINKTAGFVQRFELDGQQAFQLLAVGAQQANSSQDDFLDTIAEYSPLFQDAGYSAEGFIGTLVNAGQDGVFNLDKIADAVKETQIRLNAGDIGNAFANDLAGAPEELKAKLTDALNQATEGEISVKDFLLKATELTNEADLTVAMKSKIQVAISGTPAEDIGTELYGRIFGSPIDTDQITAQAQLAGEQIKGAIGTDNIFESLQRSGEAAFASIAASVAPVVGPLGSVLTTVGQIGPGLSLLEGKFGLFEKAGGFIKDLIPKILATIPAYAGQAVATEAATATQTGLNLAMLANPAFLLVAGVTALIGAFILFSDSTKSVDEAVTDANAALDDFNAKTQQDQAVKKQSASLRDLADRYDILKDKTDPASMAEFADVADQLAARVPSAADEIENLGGKAKITTDEVRSLADQNERLSAQAQEDSLANLADQAAALTDSLREAKEKQVELREERDKLLELEKRVGKETLDAIPSSDVFSFGSAADDLKDVREELGGVSKDVDKGEAAVRKLVKGLKDGGKTSAEIAELTGLTADEVKRYSGEQAGAADAANATAVSAKKILTDTEKAAKAAEELGKKFAEAKKEAGELSSTNVAALAETLLELEAARRSNDKVAIAAAEARVKNATTQARTAVALESQYAKFQEQAEIIAGKRKPATVSAKEIIDAEKQVLSTIKKLRDEYTIEVTKDELAKELETIRQKKEAEIESAEAQAATLRKQVEESKKAGATKKVINESAIKDFEKGGRVQVAIEEKYALEASTARIEAYKKALAETLKLETESNNKRVDQLKFEEELITGTTDEELKKRTELRTKQLLLQQQNEVDTIISTNDEYVSAYADLQEARQVLDSATTEETRRIATEDIAIKEQALRTIESDLRTSNETVLLIDKKFAREREKTVQEINKIRYDRELSDLQRSQAKELATREKTAERVAQLADDIARLSEDQGSVFLDQSLQQENDRIDKLHDERIISDAEYEKRKTKIAQDAEDARTALAGRAIGIRLEAERQAALASLELQRQQLQEQQDLAIANGQSDEAKNIGLKLKDVADQIEEKGSFIVNLSGELQTNVTDIFSNLITGDAEAAKVPFKKAFQTLVGGLQRLASAKVTQVILDSIAPGLGFGGLIASVALKPFIESILNAVLSPVFNSLLSFPTGGPIEFDSPTPIIVGDGARLGGENKEWLFRNEQIKSMIEATAGAIANAVLAGLSGVIAAIKSIPPAQITERDIFDAYQREAKRRRH